MALRMSPTKGVTLRRIPAGCPGAGIGVLRVHYDADASMTPERIAALRAKYASEARWMQEMEIDPWATEGELMYGEYKPDAVDCDPFDVSNPSEWSVWMGCDPHMRTPHGFLWEAFSQSGDSVVCGELWPSEQYSVREYAQVINWIESDSHVKPHSFGWSNGHHLRTIKRIMDTHGSAANSDEGGDFFEAYRKHGLSFYPALKSQQSLAAARDAIGERMLPSPAMTTNGEMMIPLSRVFKTCVELRNEYANVRYPSGVVERPGQEKPKTYRKHLIDARHYIWTARPSFVRPAMGGLFDEFVPVYSSVGY